MYKVIYDVGVIVYVLAFLSKALALTTWNVSSVTFGRFLHMSTIVVGNWLYIDSGDYYLLGASSMADNKLVNGALSIDLSTSWDTTTVTINHFDKPAGLQNVMNEALWWDRATSSIILFGGQPYEQNLPPSIWSLTPDGDGAGSWHEIYFPDSPLWQTFVRPEYGLRTASPDRGYFMGGVVTTNNKRFAISGLVTLDFANWQWENITTAGFYSASGMAYDGSAHFVPFFGSEGLIVMIGGTAPSSSRDVPGAVRPMSNVTIFDPNQQKWYSQTASGDVPEARWDFCLTGAQSTNKNTYEIFIYGGWTGSFSGYQNSDSSDVYILTLPAFRWIRITGSAPSRAGSSCQVVGNRHMLSIGGWDPTLTAEFTPVDPWRYSIGIFDMTLLRWQTYYDSRAGTYVRSDVVNNYYAANNLYPSWDDPALAALFTFNDTTVIPGTSNTTNPIIPNSSSTLPGGSISTSSSLSPTLAQTSSVSQSSASNNSTPAIAGGVVGGFFVLAAISVAFGWGCLKRRASNNPRRQRDSWTAIGPRSLSEFGQNRPLEVQATGTGTASESVERPMSPSKVVRYYGMPG